jgi:hypothetical protein
VGGGPPIMGAGARIRVLVDLRQDHGRVTFFLRDGASRRAASNSAGVAQAAEEEEEEEEEEGQGEGGAPDEGEEAELEIGSISGLPVRGQVRSLRQSIRSEQCVDGALEFYICGA